MNEAEVAEHKQNGQDADGCGEQYPSNIPENEEEDEENKGGTA